jgi:adenylyl- and sulfurtransferase ThiI
MRRKNQIVKTKHYIHLPVRKPVVSANVNEIQDTSRDIKKRKIDTNCVVLGSLPISVISVSNTKLL